MNELELQMRAQRKALRHDFSRTGWTLLIYYAIMNISVIITAFFETVYRTVQDIISGVPGDAYEYAAAALSSGWGYVLAVAIGLLILLLWKKPRYIRNEIFRKGAPMSPGSFIAILCVSMGCQFLIQIITMGTEILLNIFDYSVIEGLNELAIDTDSFSMFLYACILAPITEELLFRGLIQRQLRPFGRNFAILCSAFAFGVYHGNLLQSLYAFTVGLVLGYVASEYSIVWAMVLHMFNNLIIADVIPRLTASLPANGGDIISGVLMLLFAVAALVVLIVKRRSIRSYMRREPIHGEYVRCFFSSPGVIILTILMCISMLFTFFAMIRPL